MAPLSNAERQARWQAKHKTHVAELEARVAELEAKAEGGGGAALPSLSMSAQQKLEAAIRQEKRRLAGEFEQAVQAELERAVNETVLPAYNKEKAEFRRVIESRKGITTRATYRLILSWLHPDRWTDAGQKEQVAKAYHAFQKLELVLCNEKEMPTNSTPIPRTWEEMQKRRAEVKAQRRKGHAGVAHR
jgi:hypothetical protein